MVSQRLHRAVVVLVCSGLACAAATTAPAQDAPFRRADSNADGTLTLADPVFTAGYLFLRGPRPRCLDAADSNDDGRIDISDVVHTLVALFAGGAPSPDPGPECGPDPTPDGLGCLVFPPCSGPPPGGVSISEFMAVNDTTLRDGDLQFSDWIEIENAGAAPVDLLGWFLTDDRGDLTRWMFHGRIDTVLEPQERLVVFASAQPVDDYVDRAGNAHTNFALDRRGEFLALVAPDGTVVSSYGPGVPDQRRDVSYGRLRDATVVRALVAEGDAARLLVGHTPAPAGWSSIDFDDSAWEEGDLGLGYETRELGLFSGKFETDLGPAMAGAATSVFVRAPFTLDEPAAVESLTLWVRFDGGFVAFLNGVEVARANAPASPAHDAAALAPRPDAEAVGDFAPFDLSARRDLLAAGNNVLAVHALSDGLDSERFLMLPVLEADVRGEVEVYFPDPTPGGPNGEGLSGLVADTEFSVDRGFHDAPFEVAITTATPGAAIRVTTDGRPPDESVGAAYGGPIAVESTTTLRAAAFRAGFLPTNVDTQTYLFLDGPGGVLAQPRLPAGYPTQWAGVPADYEMDPEIVDHPAYSGTIGDDLQDVSTLSIVTDRQHLFGGSGLYMNPEQRGLPWERPTSMELFSADGAESFQEDAGLRIHGGAGRRPEHPKHGFRFIFRDRYGAGKLRRPLFRGQLYGATAAPDFDKLIVRAGFNNTWPHWYNEQGRRAQYVRDSWTRDLQFEMGHLSSRGRYVHLYLNGLYWGLYNLAERPDEDFGASYFGGREEDYDVIKNRAVVAGSGAGWNRLQTLASSGATTPEAYDEVLELVDVDNLIDYMLLNIYYGNLDWDNNNSIALRRRVPPGPFRFLVWDAEFAISLGTGSQPDQWPPIITVNRVSINNQGAPSGVFQGLRRNEEFRLRIADRIHLLFFNGGVLTPERVAEVWRRRADQVERAVVAESARWGDYRRDVYSRREPSNTFPLFTRDEHWAAHRQWILDEYFPARTGIVIGQLRGAGFYPDVPTPELSRWGGEVPIGSPVELSADRGVTYYTLDGGDPRLRGGEVSPSAIVAGDASFVPLLDSGVPARSLVPSDGSLGLDWVEPDFDDSAWGSGLTGVGYDRTTAYDSLIGTDVGAEMDGLNASVYVRVPFELAAVPEFEFLTLRMKYDDGFLAYLNGVLIASQNAPAAPEWSSRATGSHADSRAVVFEDIDVTAHRGLLRAGANVLAIHGLNRRVDDSDMLILPALAVNDSVRAEVRIEETVRLKARILSEGVWSPLTEALFTVPSRLVVSEIMYHPLAPRDFELAAGFDDQNDFEFLEVLNAGAAPVELAGHRFTEGIRFVFGALRLAPGERAVVVEDRAAFETRYAAAVAAGVRIAGEYDGNLSNGGETIALVAPGGREVLRFRYDDAWHPITDGGGRSLVLADPLAADPGLERSWLPSPEPLGSPGAP